ncbi:MAG: hypothetical protein AB7I30_18985, partial [Isosphaeraceae bacterium]
LLTLDVFFVIYVVEFIRLLSIWSQLDKLLKELNVLPIDRAMERLPREVSDSFSRFIGQIGGSNDGRASAEASALIESAYARSLSRELHADAALSTCRRSPVGRYLRKVDRDHGLGWSHAEAEEALRRLHQTASADRDSQGVEVAPPRLAGAILPFLLKLWNDRSMRSKESTRDAAGARTTPDASQSRPADRRREPNGQLGREHAGERAVVASSPSVQRDARTERTRSRSPRETGDSHAEGTEWLNRAEELFLIHIILHLKRFAPIVRGLTSFLILGPVLMLAAVTFYPFHPQRILTLLVWVQVLAAAAVAAWVFIQLDRDPFVSRVSRTTPNAINLDVAFLKTIGPLSLPVIGLVLTAFPSLAFWIQGLLEPLGRVMK